MAKSNIRILGSKSLPNMHRGSEASSIVCGMLEMFARNVDLFEIPAELKTTPANNWQTPRMFGEILEPNPNVDLCHFLTFASFANCSHSRENTL